MSDCFYEERNIEEVNVFDYFISITNKNNLIHIVSKIQNEYGVNRSIIETQNLVSNLLENFKQHLIFISINFSTLECDYLTTLEYLIKEFIKINFNRIINNAYENNIGKTNVQETNAVFVGGSIINKHTNQSFNGEYDNEEKYYSVVRPIGTTYDANGVEYKVNMDTQDMRPEDWQNMDVLDKKPVIVSSKNYRNGNKFPYRQTIGQVRNYERDINETLPDVRNLVNTAYTNITLDNPGTNNKYIKKYNRSIPGIMD